MLYRFIKISFLSLTKVRNSIFLACLLMGLFACESEFGKKGKWTPTYKKEVISRYVAATQKEIPSGQLDSLTIYKICVCTTDSLEKYFEPLDIEKETHQTEVQQLSRICARKVLIKD